ncbi:regulator of volume decrease after cellular swelling-domain-containing protein [Lipomyces kononenkoae]|uniref:Regulator of volume decrease after cellular swelling-domain-containing protein n=1 Tax=Lipomyces kononenkoae TaxID=34357 RepID=A0ACC3SWC3_LIPKO
MTIRILDSPPTREWFASAGSSAGDVIELDDLNAEAPAVSQDQTPNSAPGLHYHSSGRVITIRPSAAEIPGIGSMASDSSQNSVDVFVSASSLIFYVPSKSMGISIPYKHITVHAIQRNPVLGVYLQLEDIPFSVMTSTTEPKGNGDNTETANGAAKDEVEEGSDDEEPTNDEDLDGVLEMFITTLSSLDRADQEADISNLFDALSVCSALNPDLDESDGENGGMEAYGGARALDSDENIFGQGHEWITAENVHEFREADVEGEDRVRIADPRNLVDDPRFLDAEDENERPEENGDEDRVKIRRIA